MVRHVVVGGVFDEVEVVRARAVVVVGGGLMGLDARVPLWHAVGIRAHAIVVPVSETRVRVTFVKISGELRFLFREVVERVDLVVVQPRGQDEECRGEGRALDDHDELTREGEDESLAVHRVVAMVVCVSAAICVEDPTTAGALAYPLPQTFLLLLAPPFFLEMLLLGVGILFVVGDVGGV